MNRRLAILLPGVMAGALFLAACGGGGSSAGAGAKTGTTPAAAGKAAATVTMTADLKYKPDSVTIKKGETVSWKNTDSQIHDVKFKAGQNSPDVMNANQEWSRAFPDAGTFDYVCTYHEANGMKGTVVVQ